MEGFMLPAEGPGCQHGHCQVPGFVETCLGRFLSCCCVLVFCLLWCDAAQGEVGAAGVVPVDPGGGFVRRLPIGLVPQ